MYKLWKVSLFLNLVTLEIVRIVGWGSGISLFHPGIQKNMDIFWTIQTFYKPQISAKENKWDAMRDYKSLSEICKYEGGQIGWQWFQEHVLPQISYCYYRRWNRWRGTSANNTSCPLTRPQTHERPREKIIMKLKDKRIKNNNEWPYKLTAMLKKLISTSDLFHLIT